MNAKHDGKTRRTRPRLPERWLITFWDAGRDGDAAVRFDGDTGRATRHAAVYITGHPDTARQLVDLLREHDPDAAEGFGVEAVPQLTATRWLLEQHVQRLTGEDDAGTAWRQGYARACRKWHRDIVARAAAAVVPDSQEAKVLVAMLKLALTPGGPIAPKKIIVPEADPVADDANNWVRVFEALGRGKLIESVQGRRGGFRLTEAGATRADALVSPASGNGSPSGAKPPPPTKAHSGAKGA